MCGSLLPLVLSAAAAQAGTSSVTSDGNFARSPLTFTLDSRVGYDDNTLDDPDRVELVLPNRRVRLNTRGPQGSVFFNEQLSLAFSGGSSRYSLTLGATAGASFYVDRPGRDYDPNFGLNVRFAYKLTPRATFEASTFNVYQAEPDFGVVNGQTRRNGDYYYSANRFALTYRWTPLFSTVSAYEPNFYIYRQEPYSTFQDRIEQYLSQQFRFLVLPSLTVVGEYRFSYISYFSTNTDSYSHFVLGGLDYSASPRLKLSLRAGAEFRTFTDSSTTQGVAPVVVQNLDGTFSTVNQVVFTQGRNHESSPYAEATAAYDLSRRSNLALTLRYGIEQGDSTQPDGTRDTFRLGFTYNQAITPRISGYLAFFYQHSNYLNGDTVDAFGRVFSNDYNENVYDVSVGLRYAINRHFSAEVGYSHTTVDSDYRALQGAGFIEGLRDYDRNRAFAGLRVSF